MTHSSAANSSLVLAVNESKQLSQKVAQIVTLAPCLRINIDNFWLPAKDLASIAAFYSMLDLFNIHSMFGTDMENQISAMCADPGPAGMICNAYLRPNVTNSLYR